MTPTDPRSRPPIAVVGVSALFPGSVDSTGFWRDILAGTDRITDVPPSHWLIDDHFDADPSAPDKTYGRRGGFLDEIDLDAIAFGIPPNQLPSTDTSQLLALIVAQRVLDDAVRNQFTELDRSRVSVILGVTSGQELMGAMVSRMNRPLWLQGMRRAGVPEDVAQAACQQIADLHPGWTESTFPGLLGNVVAGRIANRLDLGGTNCVTDAACASSFSAISMGMNELYLGDSDMVIAGGVDTMNEVFMYMCFSKTPALSKTEDIRPFSDRADGTMLGEGVGMVALKRLADAERDGNHVYCVVNGVGTSSDGRSKSVYAPVSAGQARALDDAYAKAGYGPATVELVEAHGTGTVAGDAAEFGGLTQVFDATGRADRQWCALGSVKSQIGHTKAAAGAAGLFKVVMALHHKVLPQTAKIERPNDKLELETSPFHLNTTSRPWVRGSDHERRGSVSSFGFGGSNFHVALSEYTGAGARAPRLRTADVELVLITGNDGADVAAQATAHADLATEAGYLAWLAQTSQRAYTADAAARLAIVAADESDLRTKLGHAVQRSTTDPTAAFTIAGGIFYGVGEPQGDVAFLFPGQGSQYPFMGADLAMQFDDALAAWDLAADEPWDDVPLHSVVFPITSFHEQAAAVDDARLTATQWAQPAIGTASLAVLRLLGAVGVRPVAVAGHSFGEVTALHAAGAFGDADMITVARRRGEAMADAARTPGSMTAVSASIEDVRAVLDETDADVVIANHNSHSQVVLSGRTSEIERIEAELIRRVVAFKRLPVATAFHSSVVAGAADAFTEHLAEIGIRSPDIAVYANETARPYPCDPAAVREQLGRQLAGPVRFVETVEAMYDAGVRTFVEIGPSAVLTGLVGRILDGRQHAAIATDDKRARGLRGLMGCLGRLAAVGVPMDLGALWHRYADVADPHRRTRPQLALPINGANAGRPYPPRDLTQLAGPNPSSSHMPSITPTPRPLATPDLAGPTERAVQAGSSPSHVTADTGGGTAAAAPTQPPIHAAAPAAGVLAAFQAVQQQTAEAHTAYLNAMAQVHGAYLDAARQSLELLGRLGGGGFAPTAAVSPASVTLPIVVAPTVVPPAVVPPTVVAPTVVPPAVVPPTVAPPVVASASASTDAATSPVGVVAGVSFEGLRALLLEVVADRTGYPAEMLSMGMELESDLGIDSIKRVEILSALSDAVPSLPEVDAAVMGELATLGQIVDHLHSRMPGASEPTQADVTAPVSGLLGRFVLDVVESPSSGIELPGVRAGHIDVTDDGDGVGEVLVTMLRDAGVDARLVSSVTPDASGVVFLGGLRRVADVDQAVAVNREAFAAARAVAGSPSLFVTVTALGGGFGCDGDDPIAAWTGGLTALARTAALEWPGAGVKAIDVARGSSGGTARLIAAELLDGGPETEVGIDRDGIRRTLRSRPAGVEAGSMRLGPDDVVVVSGGARGVTAATMIELARVTRARFVLLGRSQTRPEPQVCIGVEGDAALKRVLLNEAAASGEVLAPAELGHRAAGVLASREIAETVGAIERAGATARYVSVDITDAAAVAAALAAVRAEWGPITAIVHGAGVLADRLIVDKTDAQFDAVFDTKVAGLRSLLDATSDDPVQLLCLFSSVAARGGNAGQADYAMANEVLNKVAVAEHRRRGPRCVVKSLGWGPWAGGMVGPGLEAHFAAMGVPLIPLDEGARMLVAEVAGAQLDQVEVVIGGAPTLEPRRAVAERVPA